MEITKEVAQKVLAVVDAGLVGGGLGKPIPGQMCIQAAINYALGQPHQDHVSCIGSAVRAYDIGINDGPWSSSQARAKGMRREAIAKLGSDQIDQVEFAKIAALETVRRVVPVALRSAASMIPSHKDALDAAAAACEVVVDLSAASDAASDAARAARAASDAASDAARAASYAARVASYAASVASYAASAASDAARAARAASAASDAASDAARAARAARAASAASYAASAASDAARVASYAASVASYAASVASDGVLAIAADIALQALIKLKSPGAAFLGVCK